MKNYKEYGKVYIGSSDIAALTIVGMSDQGLTAKIIDFREDGIYTAYIIDDKGIVGDHYTKVATFNTWIKIYDDEGLKKELKVDIDKKIEIYRAGMRGCIIKYEGELKKE